MATTSRRRPALSKQHAGDTALALVELVRGARGAAPVEPDCLSVLSEVSSANDELLAFDEAIMGLRVALGGGQANYDVQSDLTIPGRLSGAACRWRRMAGASYSLWLRTPAGTSRPWQRRWRRFWMKDWNERGQAT